MLKCEACNKMYDPFDVISIAGAKYIAHKVTCLKACQKVLEKSTLQNEQKVPQSKRYMEDTTLMNNPQVAHIFKESLKVHTYYMFLDRQNKTFSTWLNLAVYELPKMEGKRTDIVLRMPKMY